MSNILKQYIHGEWVDAQDGRTFRDLNPYDGSVYAQAPASGRADAERAIASAAAAFPAWERALPIERQTLFLRAASILERRAPEVTRMLAEETGASRAFATFQVQWSINLLRQVSEWGYRPVGEVLRSDLRGRFVMAVRKPLGVVVGISPWNGAHNLAWRTALLPMAFGNTVVLKPSEESPLTAGILLAQILDEAKFPAGVFNVVTHAPGEVAPIADAIFDSPHVRSINFTGSSAVGRVLASRAGMALKRIVLELGGYNPLVVLADADVEHAVATTAFGAFFHQGQICMSTRKVLVESPLYDVFLERLIAKTKTIRCGDPRLPETVIGPLINDRAVAGVKERLEEAVAKGARLLAGGQCEGRVFSPTILTNVPQSAQIARQETFGPILIVERVSDADEAIAKASDTPYGLSAGILSADQERALALAERLRAGMVHVNGATVGGEPALPNGGVRDSGWGRSGYFAIEDFTEVCVTTTLSGGMQYPM